MTDDLKGLAQQGDINAMFEYGLSVTDAVERMKWIKTSAEKGNIKAMLWCGRNMREPEERNYWWFRAIESAHPGTTDIDYFARAYAKWERWYHEDVDPYTKDRLLPLNEHIERFLIKNCGHTFEQIKSAIAPEHIFEGDYQALPKRSLRRRLFDYRGQLFLAALSDCDQEGLDVFRFLHSIRNGSFDSEVFLASEPTWVMIATALMVSWKNT